jgi:hypothetical protein
LGCEGSAVQICPSRPFSTNPPITASREHERTADPRSTSTCICEANARIQPARGASRRRATRQFTGSPATDPGRWGRNLPVPTILHFPSALVQNQEKADPRSAPTMLRAAARSISLDCEGSSAWLSHSAVHGATGDRSMSPGQKSARPDHSSFSLSTPPKPGKSRSRMYFFGIDRPVNFDDEGFRRVSEEIIRSIPRLCL